MTSLYLRRSLPWRFVRVPSHHIIPLICLKVLDPKMDQGFGEDVEDEYDVSRPLLPVEVIGIMDQILCLEVCQSCNTKYDAALGAYIPTGWLASWLLPVANVVHINLYRPNLMA